MSTLPAPAVRTLEQAAEWAPRLADREHEWEHLSDLKRIGVLLTVLAVVGAGSVRTAPAASSYYSFSAWISSSFYYSYSGSIRVSAYARYNDFDTH